MDKIYEEELKRNLKMSMDKGELSDKGIYLFGHSEATLTLADMLLAYGIKPVAIMDNNEVKYGLLYKDIPVQKPEFILQEKPEDTIVLIVTRFYESMKAQLAGLGFTGEVRKLVDYNTYAEYSLEEDVRRRKEERLAYGRVVLANLRKEHAGSLFVFCPFRALGDIYFCMAYLSSFMKKRNALKCVLCVIGNECEAVVKLFGDYHVEVFEQKEIEAVVQACIYEDKDDTFIAHQDRPYVVNLGKALCLKKIPLEKIYCCGVFGLPQDTMPVVPEYWNIYPGLDDIEEGKSVIISPYAKSVTALPGNVWEQIVSDYKGKGFRVFTNVVGDEKPLEETSGISPKLSEMKSVVEKAGTFIGIRSGLCDVIRTADCRKVALYPDYQYCDTQWKSIDIYSIDGFENIVVKDDFVWQNG